MCAVISTAVYCSCLISCFPGMLLRYFLQDFDMVPVAPYYYPSITDVFFLHSECALLLLRSLFFLNIFGFFLDHVSISWNCNVH